MNDITVIAIDTAAHALTRMAVEDSMPVAKRGVVFTDSDEAVPQGVGWIKMPPLTSMEAQYLLWYRVHEAVETSHMLCVQWDGFVLRPDLFNQEWFEYDYIGARWINGVVGNGGFSLRSKRLMEYVAKNLEFRQDCSEDYAICCYYRDQLNDFKFAPEDVARRFSYEYEVRNMVPQEDGRATGAIAVPCFPLFGFHGVYNFPFMLSPAKLEEREQLFTDYIRWTEHCPGYLERKAFVTANGNPYPHAI